MPVDPTLGVETVTDLGPVRWVAEALTRFGGSIPGWLVPAGYEACVRVENSPPDVPGEPRREGVVVAPALDALLPLLEQATGTPESVWACLWEGYGYLHGAISGLTRDGIPAHEFTAPALPVADLPRLHLPHRAYFVFRGPVRGVAYVSLLAQPPEVHWHDGPNLWWPDDRSWFVASEIDLPRTYVGCSAEFADALLAAAAIDAALVAPDDVD
jgi:hypothetical protein